MPFFPWVQRTKRQLNYEQITRKMMIRNERNLRAKDRVSQVTSRPRNDNEKNSYQWSNRMVCQMCGNYMFARSAVQRIDALRTSKVSTQQVIASWGRLQTFGKKIGAPSQQSQIRPRSLGIRLDRPCMGKDFRRRSYMYIALNAQQVLMSQANSQCRSTEALQHCAFGQDYKEVQVW